MKRNSSWGKMAEVVLLSSGSDDEDDKADTSVVMLADDDNDDGDGSGADDADEGAVSVQEVPLTMKDLTGALGELDAVLEREKRAKKQKDSKKRKAGGGGGAKAKGAAAAAGGGAKAWAAGTGYGGVNHMQQSAAQISTAMRHAAAAEETADALFARAFLKVAAAMRKAATTAPAAAAAAAATTAATTAGGGSIARWAGGKDNGTPLAMDPALKALRASAGARVLLRRLLRNDALIDVGRRAPVYRAVFKFVTTLARAPHTAAYLGESLALPTEEDEDGDGGGGAEEDDDTCGSLLRVLEQQAGIFMRIAKAAGGGGVDGEETVDALAMCLHITAAAKACAKGVALARLGGLLPAAGGGGAAGEGSGGGGVSTSAAAASSSSSSSSSSASSGAASSSSSSTARRAAAAAAFARGGAAEAAEAVEGAAYVRALKPLRFDAVDLVDQIMACTGKGGVTHSFMKSGGAGGGGGGYGHHQKVSSNPRKRLLRIQQEISGLLTNLPVHYGSSIFVRVDEDRPDMMKALITGPEDTPYANGCFEFDICLPPDYPESPPKVLLTTTGQGRVRFNPNLYNCGKVCLSLLGTWQGPGWDPKASTLLQVLMSIQALIFVANPYFNEPGYEASMGTPQGDKAGAKYNAQIRMATLTHAVLGMINSPPPIFADVVRAHFARKRRAVLALLSEWLEQEASSQTAPPPPKKSKKGGYAHHGHGGLVADGGMHPSETAMRAVMGQIQQALEQHCRLPAEEAAAAAAAKGRAAAAAANFVDSDSDCEVMSQEPTGPQQSKPKPKGGSGASTSAVILLDDDDED